MKIIFSISVIFLIGSMIGSCVKTDNYPGPNASVNGTITDSVTGQPFQSGPMDERLYVLQTNYTAGTPVPFYWNVQPGGLYNNTAVFSGSYKIYPTDGAFVPLVYTSNGSIIDHGSKQIQVNPNQNTTTNFTVTPFLVVNWVGDPVLNADSTVTISCTVTRGTSDPLWTFNVTDVFFVVSNTDFISAQSGDFETPLSNDITYSGTAGNAILGTTLTIKSKGKLGVHQGYYLRVGARTADNVNKRYNYTTVKMLNVP